MTRRRPDASVNAVGSTNAPTPHATSTEDVKEPSERFVDWSNITAALREKLTTVALDKTLEYVLIYLFIPYRSAICEIKCRLWLL